MVSDPRIYTKCDHRVVEEQYKIDLRDMRTLLYTGDANIFLSHAVFDEPHSFGEKSTLSSNEFILNKKQILPETVSLKTIGSYPIFFTKDLDFKVEAYNPESISEEQYWKVKKIPRIPIQIQNEFLGTITGLKTKFQLQHARVNFPDLFIKLNGELIESKYFNIEPATTLDKKDSVIFTPQFFIDYAEIFSPQNPGILRADYNYINNGIMDFESVKCDYVYLENTSGTRISRPISSKNVELFLNGYNIPKDHPIYAWELLDDELSVQPDKKIKIVFRKPLKSTDDLIKINYYTNVTNCRKCLGFFTLNDLSYDSTGKVILVSKESKLMQDLLKGIITEIGSNVFHPWIGTSIPGLIGSKFQKNVTTSLISREVANFVSNYRDIQIKASRYQKHTPEEMVSVLNKLDVTESDLDPTLINLFITVSNRVGNQIELTQPFKVGLDPSIVTDKRFKELKNPF